MPTYAENTQVDEIKSRNEIERTLKRYGATGFMFGWDEGNGRQFDMIGFRMNDKLLRFVLPLPARDDDEFKYTPVER